jgi:hypothetical protein
LQKKRQSRQHRPLPGPLDHPSVPPPPDQPRPSKRKPFDLEEQLRRILEGDDPAPPRVPAPPLVTETPLSPPPLPKTASAEVIYSETEEPAARAMGRCQGDSRHMRAAQLPRSHRG